MGNFFCKNPHCELGDKCVYTSITQKSDTKTSTTSYCEKCKNIAYFECLDIENNSYTQKYFLSRIGNRYLEKVKFEII